MLLCRNLNGFFAYQLILSVGKEMGVKLNINSFKTTKRFSAETQIKSIPF